MSKEYVVSINEEIYNVVAVRKITALEKSLRKYVGFHPNIDSFTMKILKRTKL